MPSRKRNRQPVKQTTPTYDQLVEKHLSGFTSKKEIMKHVNRGLPNKASDEQKESFARLESLATDNGWI